MKSLDQESKTYPKLKLRKKHGAAAQLYAVPRFINLVIINLTKN